MLKSFITSIFILSVFVSCAVNPVTGKRQFMLVSEQQEIQMGAEYDPQISQMYGVYNDPKITKYVDDLGQKMVKVSHRSNLKFSIKVMDSPVINAFAVPGGYLYITRGILAYLNSEAELAGVMGHEIGHVTARHSASQQSKAQLAQIGLGLGAAFSETFAQYAGVAQQATQLLFLKFGRDDETQSDKLGVEYATKVGYDSKHMANFFTVLDKMHGGSGNGLPSFLSTHPNPADRVVKVGKETEKWQKKVSTKNFVVNRDGYLKMIDGIIFGPDPRQGFSENNVFYHPELRFQFPTPKDWVVNNLPSQVQVISADKKAVLIFKLAEGSDLNQATNKFLTENKMIVESRTSKKVNGAQSELAIGTVNTQQGAVKLMLHMIKRDGRVYTFIGYSDPQGFATYQTVLSSISHGFKGLNDKSKINRKPDRIKVRSVARNMSLRNAFKSFGIADDKLEEHALLNGAMGLDSQVKAKMLLKTIVRGN